MIDNPQPGQRCWYFSPQYASWSPGPATVVRQTDTRVVVRFDRFPRSRAIRAENLYATQEEYSRVRQKHAEKRLYPRPVRIEGEYEEIR